MIEKYKFSPFQLQVLKKVLEIPLGSVRSYKWVAKEIGRPKAVRAVGTTLKNNPFPLIVPCHRVIKADGTIGGYSDGINKKIRLLKLEKELAKLLNI